MVKPVVHLVPLCVIVILTGGVAYLINRNHPDWTVDDFSKLAALWFTLAGVLYTGWITWHNTDRQIAATTQLATDQQKFTEKIESLRNGFQKDMESFKKDLALELEETKVKLSQRYIAQATLNRVAMMAGDRINRLQLGSSTEAETLLRLNELESALLEMDAQRGLLFMTPATYRKAWQDFEQQVTYVTGRLKEDVTAHRQINLREFYVEDLVGRKSTELWYAFEQQATFD